MRVTYDRAAFFNVTNLGAARPSRITYTGHGQVDGNREVRFSYEGRQDKQLRSMPGGMGYLFLDRLAQITTYVNQAPVRNYRIQYDATQTLSQIASITECVGDVAAQCKTPTKFTYASESGFTLGSGFTDLDSAVQLDANGDGIPDFLETIKTVGGVVAHPEYKAAAYAGDLALGIATSFMTGPTGFAVTVSYMVVKEVVLGLLADSPEIRYTSNLYLGTGDRAHPTNEVPQIQGFPCDPGHPMQFLDFDRDGKDDVMADCGITRYGRFGIATSATSKMMVALSSGAGNFVGATPLLNLSKDPNSPSPIVFDIDGDSLQDIVSCASESQLELRRRVAPGQNFEAPISLFLPLQPNPGSKGTFRRRGLCSESRPTYLPFDIDGDGTPDLLFRSFDGWKVLRYSSTAPRLSLQPVEFGDWGGSHDGSRLIVDDLNGDGLVDMSRVDGGQAVYWLNTGGGNFAPHYMVRPQPALDLLTPPVRHVNSAILDYDADGVNDLLEDWQGQSPFESTIPAVRNVALFLNPSLNGTLDYQIDQFIKRPINGVQLPANFTTVADVDGDGNLDLFGQAWGMFYGSGTKNKMLTQVEDGLGNQVKIRYDEAGAYVGSSSVDATLPSCAGTWPEQCLHQMNGLVSSYTEGFKDTNGQEIVERTYRHKYFNGRMNVTGLGWLGFDRTSVREESLDSTTRIVTTDFEPVRRTRLDGSPATDLRPPYLYPLANLPKTIKVDGHASSSGQAPLDEAENGYRRRTRIENHWEVKLSAANLTFPHLSARETTAFEHERPGIVIGEPAPDIEDGEVVSWCTDLFDNVDLYGNEQRQTRECIGHDLTVTNTSFAPNASEWLISNPEYISKTNTRALIDSTATQTWNPGYDALGRLTSIERGQTASDRHTVTFALNAFGSPDQVTESVASGELSRPIIFTYEGDNVYPKTITNPLGQVTQVVYDSRWGSVITVADPNDVVVKKAYDGFGLLKESEDPSGTTVYSHAVLNSRDTTPAGVNHPRIEVTTERQGADGTPTGRQKVRLDNHGRQVSSEVQGFAGVAVLQQQAYDLAGHLAKATLPYTSADTTIPTTEYAYDGFDRVTAVQHSDGKFVQHQYASKVSLDTTHRHWLKGLTCQLETYGCAVSVERTIDEEGRENVVVKDHLESIVRNIDGENVGTTARYTGYFYGAFNQLAQIDHNRNDLAAGSDPLLYSTFESDAYGRLLSETDPDTGATTYTYNGFDELRTSLDPKGQQRTYAYDRLGRPRTIIDATTGAITEWKYDLGVNAIGRVSETISPPTSDNPLGNHVLYTYEPKLLLRNRGALANIDYKIDGTDYNVGFSYDGHGRPKQVSYPQIGAGNPIVAEYQYDAFGRLFGLDEVGSSATRQLWRLTEAKHGFLPQKETFDNGAEETSYGYDTHRRFLGSLRTTRGSSLIQDLQYTRYDDGRIKQRTTPDAVREYTYDALRRLKTTSLLPAGGTAVTTNYDYDRLGNLIQRGDAMTHYSQLHPHWVETVGDNSYHYDSNGNVDGRSGPDIPGGVQTVDYTPFDLPSRIVSGQTGVTRTTQFEYSADEERMLQRDSGSNTTRYFAGDFYQRLVDATGATLEQRFRLYADGREIGEILRRPGGDQTQFFHGDHLESVTAISTGAGNIWTQEFDDFGMRQSSSVPSSELPRAGFTGHQHDWDDGLIDMKGRIYDPLAGRFMSPDPVTQAPFWSQGLNRYSYVFNDPINNTDPSGFNAVNDIGRGLTLQLVFGGRLAALQLVGAHAGGMGLVGGLGFGGAAGLQTKFLTPNFDGSPGSTTSVPAGQVAPAGGGTGLGGGIAAGMNKVQEGNAIAGGAGASMTPRKPVPMTLKFNIKEGRLSVRNSDRQVYVISASSGRGKCLNSSSSRCVGLGFEGPVVPGSYKILASEVDTSTVKAWWRYAVKGQDWGSFRAPLHPDAATSKAISALKRSGNFFLHGGVDPGTAGCIDCGGGLYGNAKTDRLAHDLEYAEGGEAQLTVVAE